MGRTLNAHEVSLTKELSLWKWSTPPASQHSQSEGKAHLHLLFFPQESTLLEPHSESRVADVYV